MVKSFLGEGWVRKRWFVYLLRCADGSLYAGVKTYLVRRLAQHNSGRGGACTRARRPVRIVFQEAHANQSSAQRREAQIKHLPRAEKASLFRRKIC